MRKNLPCMANKKTIGDNKFFVLSPYPHLGPYKVLEITM